jgi:hypothetical protein
MTYIRALCQKNKAKGLISGSSAGRIKDLLKLNRDQIRQVIGLLTGHCHLKGQLFKLGLIDDPICKRCLEEDESATHIPCDCEAVAYLRFHQLGRPSWNEVTIMTPPYTKSYASFEVWD